jgi:pre-mRNA-splicing factor CDC5/CEF1
MVRIMVKGGVFTNVEDEILKAAVMKYGKMQWARVASLLNRKSAKQCKARWFEWLDPSIKKTDWTQEEEEKLLHLAKLMPNQWRTIASIVGRTAAQCLEHYERLLDQAQASSASASGEAASSDARKLRPGEIDPAPETKPARPDPVDMDEDEKEMLQEARARLSNTRGKKAKRKAREKQLEEAQRLASLQKRRELKAAGIEMRVNRNKRRKNMDYGSEIPFHMTVPAGFYDTTDEQEATKRARMDPKLDTKFLQDLEAKRRDEEEEKNKKKDAAKIRKLMKTNLPQQIMAVSMLNDPMDVRRRTPLQLPAPQVSDRELEDIAKLGAGAASSASRGAGGLIGDYAEASAPTPMRTPSATSGQDVVMQEARTLLALRSAQTPLLGGENATLEEGTGFDGATPRTSRSETPSMLRESVTPAPGTQVSGTPMQAPLRDQLGLNQSDDFSLTPASRKEQRARERLAKEALKAKLAG